jgi:hypothetical protein
LAEIASHLQLDDAKKMRLATMIELSVPGFRRAPWMSRTHIDNSSFRNFCRILRNGLKTRFSVSASASAQSASTLWPWRA